jgi:hypothetical protein
MVKFLRNSSIQNLKFVAKIPERGARMARREERANREFVSDEQRRQPGCPAREFGDELRIRDTRHPYSFRRESGATRSTNRLIGVINDNDDWADDPGCWTVSLGNR